MTQLKMRHLVFAEQLVNALLETDAIQKIPISYHTEELAVVAAHTAAHMDQILSESESDIQALHNKKTEAHKKQADETNRFTDPQAAVWTGRDESDSILCPHCDALLAIVDEDPDLRPNHCPDCGTKIKY